MSSDAPKRRRRRTLLGIGLAVLALAAGAGAYVLTHGPGNVSNSGVEFKDGNGKRRPVKRAKAKPLLWPTYGFSADRRRVTKVPKTLKPPFKRKWFFDGGVLLEFPPVLSARSLFLLKDDGVAQSIDKKTGKVRWSRHLGDLAASSPHLHGERLYMTILERTGGGSGRVVAVTTNTGRKLWSRDLPSRTESSPVVSNGLVYVGSEDGTVYALRESNGSIKWTFKATGPVKSALALKDGTLYFGDYAGKMYAIRASNGKEVWQASTQGARFGFASGRFYSTPAVAYGRVYVGNVDSYIYSFSAKTGELAWRTQTSGYVYSSPAVGAAPGDKPTVYAGSYDGNFYALDARSGAVRWTFDGGGKISGGSNLINGIVYYSDLGNRRTFGLNARTGKKVFEFPRGGYNPVVTDGRTLFLVGYGAVYALKPRSVAKQRRQRAKAVQRRRDCVALARRNYPKGPDRKLSFRRCVVRTNASRKPLPDRKPREKIPKSFSNLFK